MFTSVSLGGLNPEVEEPEHVNIVFGCSYLIIWVVANVFENGFEAHVFCGDFCAWFVGLEHEVFREFWVLVVLGFAHG